MVRLLRDSERFCYRTTGKRADRGDVEAALQSRGWVRELGTGTVAVSGPFLHVMRWVRERFHAIVREMGAEEVEVPDLMLPRAIEASNYLNSFPHHALLAHAHDPQSLDQRVSAGSKQNGHGLLLTPTVCLNVFELLRGKAFDDGAPRLFVSTKRCFREEAAGDGLGRLRNFTMLEAVVFGSASDVRRLRAELAERTADVLLEVDLVGEMRKASDAFFHDSDGERRRLFEERFDIKYELTLRGPRGPLACSSFNLHADFFTRRFAITTRAGATPWSGCAGWGLERWALAFFAQHGMDPRDWPANVKGLHP